jgi:three-Cys-motif partner protein
MKKRNPHNPDKGHAFGGDWTTDKLGVLAEYLTAYTTALKDQPFKKGYIDAFAGTGYRAAPRDAGSEAVLPGQLFPDLAEDDSQNLLDGSARLALKTEPRFDRYLFIERHPVRCAELEKLKEEFPKLAKDIEVYPGEANAKIRELCERDWRRHRAVLFLDPYGMQVEWTTIEKIASTKAIDLWVLFPLGMGVNRLLKKTGDIPREWRSRLDALLGTKDWYEEFYRFKSSPTLFDESAEQVVKASTEVIGRYFNRQLKSVFAGVADEPKVLRNSKRAPLYLLCFAVGNEKAAPVALRIANHLLKKGTA